MISILPLTLLLATAEAASFPGAQPQLAGAGRRVGLVFGRDNKIYFALSRDGGRAFGQPSAIPTAGRLHLGNRRGPRLALVDDTFVVTAIVGKGREDGDLLAWRSTDDGRSWTGPTRLNQVEASAREGLHGMGSGGGLLAVAWLDLRGAGTQVYAVVSRDHGATWSKDYVVYAASSEGVCECCHPSVAVSRQGELAIMFRNHLGGSRDLYMVRATTDGKPGVAVKLGQGTWPLNACPMDGGSLVFAGEQGPLTVWRRATEVFLARLGAPEVGLGEGIDPVLAATEDGTTYTLWRRGEGLVLASSRQPGVRSLVEKGRSPVILALDDGSLLGAWQQDERVFVTPIPR